MFWKAIFCLIFVTSNVCAWDRTAVWDPPANPPDVPSVMEHRLYSGPEGGPYNLLATVAQPDNTAAITGQTGKVCFVVTAVNVVGESDLSDEVCGPKPSKATGLSLQ